MRLAYETTASLGDAAEVAVLPVGSVEQHGPALPLGTDFLAAEAVADAVAETERLADSPLTEVLASADREAAADLASQLVEERLAACVNRVRCRSTYRWEGAVHDDDEEILLAKTTDEACDELMARVEELHPHDVPAIERFDVADATAPFEEWLDSAVETGEN
jgi:periplasmic divalent cation tolerance protein